MGVGVIPSITFIDYSGDWQWLITSQKSTHQQSNNLHWSIAVMLENIKYYRNYMSWELPSSCNSYKNYCVWNVCLIERLKLDRARTYRKNQNLKCSCLRVNQIRHPAVWQLVMQRSEKVHCNTSYENTGEKR